MFHKSVLAFGLAAALLPLSAAHAGVYTDDLSKCLISHMTAQDQTSLARFIFAALSTHPAVQNLTSITDGQRQDIMDNFAAVAIKGLTVSCHKESVAALKYEGDAAIGTAFTVYGQAAARVLFSDPEVAKSMSSLNKFDDNKPLKDLMAEGGITQSKTDAAKQP